MNEEQLWYCNMMETVRFAIIETSSHTEDLSATFYEPAAPSEEQEEAEQYWTETLLTGKTIEFQELRHVESVLVRGNESLPPLLWPKSFTVKYRNSSAESQWFVAGSFQTHDESCIDVVKTYCANANAEGNFGCFPLQLEIETNTCPLNYDIVESPCHQYECVQDSQSSDCAEVVADYCLGNVGANEQYCNLAGCNSNDGKKNAFNSFLPNLEDGKISLFSKEDPESPCFQHDCL